MPSSEFVSYSVAPAIARFLRSLTEEQAAAELGVPTEEQATAQTAARLPRLLDGRTLVAHDIVVANDYGTFVHLNTFRLAVGAIDEGNILGVSGPGELVTEDQGTIYLASGETALVVSDALGNLNLCSIARNRNALRFVGPTEPADAEIGDEWFNSDDLQQYIWMSSGWELQSLVVPYTGYLRSDGQTIVGATAGSTTGTPDTLVVRGAGGEVVGASTEGRAVSGTLTSAVSRPDQAGAHGSTNAPDAFGLLGQHTGSGWAVKGVALTGLGGLWGVAGASGTGVLGQSASGTGGRFVSTIGDYHAMFGETTGNNRSAIERTRGWLVWFFSYLGVARKGRLKTADLTADRDWTLPNVSGTISLEGHTHPWSDLTGVPPAQAAVSDTAPTSPADGTIWSHGTTGVTLIWHANPGVWVADRP